jgi:hypothetical protein
MSSHSKAGGAVYLVESKEPMRLAELALRVLLTDQHGRHVLRRWRDRFYLWSPGTGSYTELHRDAMKAALYQLLGDTRYESRNSDGEIVKRLIRPTSTTVREVTSALVAGTLVTGDAPQWLVSSSVSPDVILAVRNGLLDVQTRKLIDHLQSSSLRWLALSPTGRIVGASRDSSFHLGGERENEIWRIQKSSRKTS